MTQKLRRLIMTASIGLALLAGAPLHPGQIEDLFRQLNQPKIAHSLQWETLRPEDPKGEQKGPGID